VLLNEFYKSYLLDGHNGCSGNVELALKNAIKRTRTINNRELLNEYDIDEEKEYPYFEPEHWASWICFSNEEWDNP
jgi:hypothetical protein